MLIVLVQNKKTADDYFSDLRKYDAKDEWTYSLNDKELRELIDQDFIPSNKSMNNQLLKYGFTIYDTSKDREQIFNKIVEDIKLELAECKGEGS